ncbi:MAG: universal stress protein [Chloroflexota bacterium]|nr:universal stress protein [Chloroflexota bacterium]
MYEHLLVALDGSNAAEQVLPHAEALADAFGARVILLRAVASAEMLIAQSTGGGPGMPEMATPVDPTPIYEAERSAAAEYLTSIQARLRSRNLPVSTETPEGNASDLLVQRAEQLDRSLILMTTHGRGGVARLMFGSTADSVLRHSTRPVLLIRIRPQD